jgi:hypothetical protein
MTLTVSSCQPAYYWDCAEPTPLRLRTWYNLSELPGGLLPSLLLSQTIVPHTHNILVSL